MHTCASVRSYVRALYGAIISLTRSAYRRLLRAGYNNAPYCVAHYVAYLCTGTAKKVRIFDNICTIVKYCTKNHFLEMCACDIVFFVALRRDSDIVFYLLRVCFNNF